MGMVYARRFGLPVVATRAFNHTGHGRQAVNAESAFARRIVEAERGHADHVVHGDLSARRNFSHVLDVVAAYRVAIEQPPGIYNVASPGSVTLREVMDLLLGLSSVPGIPLKQDPRYPRTDQPGTFPAVDTRKLAAAGWEPGRTLQTALEDVLDYWRTR
jgi:GDP-4-dehydro-6-deoxy-D-mannose reductase